MSRNALPETDAKSKFQVTATGLEPTTTYFVNVYELSGYYWV